MTEHAIRIRTWIRGTADEERTGLVGYLSLYYGDVAIDGVTVRRTAAGKLVLSFPKRQDRYGITHMFVKPVDDAARRRIEAAVFRQASMAPEVQS